MTKGYAKTTLEDIVRNVGLTRGAFYWHFKKKRDLLLEIEKRYQYSIEHLFQIEYFPTAYESLAKMITRNLQERVTMPNDFLYFIRYRIEAETELENLIGEQRQLDFEVMEKIAEQIRRGIAAGEFPQEIDVERKAFYIYTNLIGVGTFMTTHMADKDAMDSCYIPDDFAAYADLLLMSLKKR